MVDVAVTVSVFGGKIFVDQSRIIFRLYVRVPASAALSADVGHILADTHDLACFDRRVRSTGISLVSLKVVPKDA